MHFNELLVLLCLGGRSHKAYSSRGVSQSVAMISRSSLKTNR